MKKNLFLLLVAICAITFNSCSSDNDDALSKRISTIKGNGLTLDFTYNTQGKVVKIKETTTTESIESLITYDNNKVIFSIGNDKIECFLTNGRTTTMSSSLDKTEYTFEYDKDGYMTKSTDVDLEQPNMPSIITYTWQNGNLVSYSDDGVATITYGSQLNNLNLDILPLTIDMELGSVVSVIGIGSKRSINLPEKITSGTDEIRYTYVKDKDGYIIGINITSNNTNNVPIFYEIIYK
ncbi:MAG: DUF4595 domain-containing protein [Rikenellaceae bacterium]